MLSVPRRTEGCQCLDGRSVVSVWGWRYPALAGRKLPQWCFTCFSWTCSRVDSGVLHVSPGHVVE